MQKLRPGVLALEAPTTTKSDALTRAASDAPSASGKRGECFHCGTPCRDRQFQRDEKVFCCHGCLTVFELLTDNGLDDFYELGPNGVRVNAPAAVDQFKFLDQPAVRDRLADFSDDKLTRITLHLPAIHCVACVWLLENLFQLRP